MLSIVKTEQQCLNCLWDDPRNIYKFDQPYFVSQVGNDFLESLKQLYENEVPFTVDDVVAVGNKRNSAITRENIESLRSVEYDPASFDFYFQSLRKNFAKHKIENKLLRETLLEVSSKGELDTQNIRSLIEDMNSSLDMIEGKESALHSLGESLSNYRGVLVQRKRGEYKFPTGDSHLDRHLETGYPPGEITTYFGPTGVGKSTYVLNQVSRQINKRIPSVYFTLEMSEVATIDRLIAQRQRVPQSFFRLNEDGELPEGAFEVLEKEVEHLQSLKNNFFLVDDSSLSRHDLEHLIQEAQRRMQTRYLVASIDLWSMLSDSGEKASEIEEAMNGMHAIAKRNGVHIVIVVQANREAEKTGIRGPEEVYKLRPGIVNIKNSAAIAERSRRVLGIFRPRYFVERLLPEHPELPFIDDILEVQVLKNSNGPVGQIIRYYYDAECFRVYPYIDESEL